MKNYSMRTLIFLLFLTVFSCLSFAQENDQNPDVQKAEAVLQKAVQKLGGDRYLQIKSSVGRGFYTQIGENASGVPSGFVDTIVFPDKERTEFKIGGVKRIQVNVGETGWIYDGFSKKLNDQTPDEVANFKQGIRTGIDHLLRGGWRKENARLEYVGRRAASLGKRNEVVKLIYPDGLSVEFEFAATDGLPAKSFYKRKSADGEDVVEETRYAQFLEVNGITAPFIIDFYRNGKQTSRVNYQTIEFNVAVADSLFAKPADPKKVK
jgi:outer membrane lipoprotein-sorting protein